MTGDVNVAAVLHYLILVTVSSEVSSDCERWLQISEYQLPVAKMACATAWPMKLPAYRPRLATGKPTMIGTTQV